MAVADAAATNGLLHTLTGRLRQYAPGSDVGLAIGVVALLSVLILPLPTMLLDFGLAISLTASVLVLMVALFLTRPLDFTSFPTLLLVVNFMVITKGSGRIAEVAARFSLDAMPGKQMAIDAEMSAGLIDEKVARRR